MRRSVMPPLLRALCGLGLACAAMAAPAQTDRPEYGIRKGDPPLGSLIRRYAVEGSPIPINRRYEELTPQERASINQYYELMQPGDEPPFPLEGLKPFMDAVRRGQQKLLVQGELILLASVGPDGEVTEVKAIRSPDPEMTKFAASVLFLTKFKPALCQGQPCRMDYPFRFEFRVER